MHEEAVESAVKLKRNESIGQFDLFGAMGDEGMSVLTVDIPEIPEWPKREKLQHERDMLGLYVSDHPLSGIHRALERYQGISIGHLIHDEGSRDNQTVKIAGLVTKVDVKTTRKGELWAIVTLEDLSGSIDVLFFPRSYEAISHILATDLVVQVEGRVMERDTETTLSGMSMTVLDLREDGTVPVVLDLPYHRCTKARPRRSEHDHPKTIPDLRRFTCACAGRGQAVTVDLIPRSTWTSSSFFADLKATLSVSNDVARGAMHCRP